MQILIGLFGAASIGMLIYYGVILMKGDDR